MRVLVIHLIFNLGFLLSCCGQSIHWTHPDQLADSLSIKQKPILIFLYTDWCKFCKKQERTTLEDKGVIQIINENFYAVKLNAESNQSLHFINRSYSFDPSSGYHELATYLGKKEKELVFPTTVLLQANLQNHKKLIGYQSKKWMVYELLTFIDSQ